MYFLLRLSPFLTSFAGFLLFDLLLRKPEWAQFLVSDVSITRLLVLMGGVAISLLVTLVFLGAGQPLLSRIRFAPYLLLLWLSGMAIFFFSDTYWQLRLISVAVPLLHFIWLESLFFYWQRSMAYQAYTLERISSYLYLLIFFLFTSAISGLQILVQIPFWLVVLFGGLVYCLLLFDLYSLHKLQRGSALILSALGGFLTLQLLVALNLLPTHFFLYGLIITLFLYSWNTVILQVFRDKSRDLNYLLPVLTSTSGGLVALISILFWR